MSTITKLRNKFNESRVNIQNYETGVRDLRIEYNELSNNGNMDTEKAVDVSIKIRALRLLHKELIRDHNRNKSNLKRALTNHSNRMNMLIRK